MNNSPPLFDPQRIARNRKRASAKFADHSFLHKRIWQELLDRKATIKRQCKHGEIIGDLVPQQPELKDSNWIRTKTSLATGSELDFLISFLELHLIDDLPGMLSQYQSALKPDGVFLGAMFGGHTLTELRQSLFAAESELNNGVAARIIPFVDIRTLGQLVQAASFTLPVIDVDTITVWYPSIIDLLHDLRNMGEANPGFAPFHPLSRKVLKRADQLYSQEFADKRGLLPARFDVLHVCGWAAHESQQKPLAPGSAQVFLGDALNKS